MATEFRLGYTGAEINQKLAKVDEIEIALENEYYTSTDIDTKIDEVNTSIEEVNASINEVNTSIEEVNTSIETGLQTKADLVDGKIPVSQLPDDIGGGSDVDLSDYYTKTETDAVLSVKADLVDGKVPLEQLPDDISSSGGLTEVDWETNVINKPFYDTRIMSYYSQTENPNPLQVDNPMMNMSFYKVSDLIPSRDEIFNNCKVTVNGTVCGFAESGIQLETDDFVFVGTSGGFGFIFVNKSGTLNFTASGYPMSIEVPEGGEGIYYQRDLNAGVPAGRIIEFQIGDGELKQIDPKFIPADLDFNLDDYYTKNEVDNAINNIDLSRYYTKDETYSKSEVDAIIGDIDTVINEINSLIGE